MEFLAVISGLMHGLAIAFEPTNLFYCLIGCLLGTMIGVLPGLGPLNAMAMLLPISYYLPPEAALILLAGIYYGAQYRRIDHVDLRQHAGRSRFDRHVPGRSPNGAAGRAGPALAIAALVSVFAGVVATLFIAFFAPPLAQLALLFGPTNTCADAARPDRGGGPRDGIALAALGMLCLGLLLGTVGVDVETGAYRMTMGFPQLADGIGIVSVAMGLFRVGEIISNLEHKEKQVSVERRIHHLWPSRDDFRRCWPVVLRATGLGSVLGLLPGGGAMLSSFAAYALEKKISADPSRFGKGAVEGVAAPEAANNAGAQTSFIPLLTSVFPQTR